MFSAQCILLSAFNKMMLSDTAPELEFQLFFISRTQSRQEGKFLRKGASKHLTLCGSGK